MDAAELWLGRPRILPGESFSSWFARTAAANGLSPADLFSASLPGAYRYTRDLDRYIEPGLIANLAASTGVPAAALLEGTLARWAGKVFGEDDGLSKLPWLPVAGGEDGQRSFGQQVCPSCLREDEQPYLRTSWRLAFVTVCPRHHRHLVDRCRGCGEPIQVLRSGLEGSIQCWNCFADIARVPAEDVFEEDATVAQTTLLAIAETGWLDLGAYGPIYAFAYFRILMLVFRLLATGRHANPLRAWCEVHRPSALGPTSVPRIRQVELLNPRCRFGLIRMMMFLTEDWPTRFVAACRCVGLSSRDLLKTGRTQPYPFAFAHAVDWNLSTQFRAVSAEEVESAKAYLHARSVAPTYRALADLFGVKLTAHRNLAEPANNALPPGQGRYWKLDGVSPEVKIAARKAALRAGERLGPWVDALLRRELNLAPQDTQDFS